MIKKTASILLLAILTSSLVVSSPLVESNSLVQAALHPEVEVGKQPDDPHTRSFLVGKGIDPNYVEIVKNYGIKSEGKSPYGRTYRDSISGQYIYEVSALPMVDADGTSIVPEWDLIGNAYHAKNNLFSLLAVDANNNFRLTTRNDQPDGRLTNETLVFRPELWFGNSQQSRAPPTLLAIDPINTNYTNNTLEWSYAGGQVLRRLRLVEGSMLGSWTFLSNPNSEVTIIYNQSGNSRLKLGQFAVDDDTEVISLDVFDNPTDYGLSYPIVIPDSATFYPDAHVETSSVDGEAGHVNADGTWQNIHDGAGTRASDAGTQTVQILIATGNTALFKQIRRMLEVYDTSGLDDTANITDAVLSVYGFGKADPSSIAMDLNVYASAPATNTAIVAGDYDSLGTTPFSDTAITYAGFSTAGYNDFTLNAAGIAAISKTSVSKFGLRNANYDAADSAPVGYGTAESNLFNIYEADQGDGFKPKLVVTYTLISAPIVATQNATSIEETTATLSGNITNIGSGADVDDRGFEWDTNSGSPYSTNWTEAGSFSTGTYTYALTSLTKGELYYYRAMASNDEVGYGYGSEVLFLTKPDPPYNLAAVSTSNGTLTLTWSKGQGALNTYIRGKAGSYPTNRSDGYLVYDDTGTTDTDTGLTGGTTYYYRAWSYATEGGEEQYSDTYDQANALAIAYPSITTNAAQNVGEIIATLSGTITATGNGGNDFRGFVYDTTSRGAPGDVVPAGSSYNSTYTEGGVFGVGDFTHTLSGLIGGTTYYYRAFAHNSVGWAYGNEVSFTTIELVLWFLPIAIIEGTNLPNRSGSSNGTIVWGSNPTGVSVSLSGATFTTTVPTALTSEPADVMPLTTDVPELVSGVSTEGTNFLFYPLFKDLITQFGFIDMGYFWIIVAAALILMGSIVVLMVTRSPAWSWLLTSMLVAVAANMGIWDWWILYLYIPIGLGFIVFQKVYSLS